jgi:anti-sigma factor RsiW
MKRQKPQAEIGDRDREMIQALLDGEIHDAEKYEFERRLKKDVRLSAALERYASAKAMMNALPRPKVSPDLRARITSGIARPVPAPAQRQRTFSFGDWRSLAASMALVVFLASGTTYILTNRFSGPDETAMIAASHRRSLLAASPYDIASSDRHTVKPWLDAKLGLSPPVVDLADQGFSLLGARLDVLAAGPVPALVYRHKEHLLTLITEPLASSQTGSLAPESRVAGGLQMIHWIEGGYSFWAVSDMDRVELAAFVSLFRQRAARAGE